MFTYCIEKSAFVMSWISSSWRLVSFYGCVSCEMESAPCASLYWFLPEFGVNSCKRSERKSLCFSSFLYQLYQIYIVNLSWKTAFAMSKTFFYPICREPFFKVLVDFFYSKHKQEGKYILLRYHPFTKLVFYAASIVLQSATCDEEIIVL